MNEDRPARSESVATGTHRPADPGPEDETGRAATSAAGAAASSEAADDAATEPGPVQTVEIRRGGGLAAFALLVALAGVAGSAYLWWTLRTAGPDEGTVQLRAGQTALEAEQTRLRDELGAVQERIDQLETRAAAAAAVPPATAALEDAVNANRTAAARLEDRVTALGERIDGLASDVAARPETIVPAAPPAAAPPAPATDVFAFRQAEIELLLRIAQREVSLAGDPAAAREALAEADRLIDRLDEPALAPVRRQIAEDVTALEALPELDLDGTAFRLGSLQARVADLPVREESVRGEPPGSEGGDDTDSGLARLERKSKEFISGLVRVRESSGDAPVFHSPSEIWFLRRNLELELQSARVALLTGNGAAYADSLRQAGAWAGEYFDADDPGVEAFLEGLDELAARPVEIEYPALGALDVYLASVDAAAPE